MTRDGGGPIVLGAVSVALAGLVLALTLRQRRVWVRVRDTPGGLVAEVAALPRNQAAGTGREFTDLVRELRSQAGVRADLTEAPAASDAAATTGR